MESTAYSRFHGSATVSRQESYNLPRYVTPLYKLPLSNYTLRENVKRLANDNFENMENDIVNGYTFKRNPQLHAIAIYFGSPVIDVLVFSTGADKVVALYLTKDFGYTTSPGLFIPTAFEAFIKPVGYIHSLPFLVDSSVFFDLSYDMLKSFLTETNDSVSVPFFVTSNETSKRSCIWVDPFDKIVPGLSYYSPSTEKSYLPEDFQAELQEKGRIRYITSQPDFIDASLLTTIEKMFKYNDTVVHRMLELPFAFQQFSRSSPMTVNEAAARELTQICSMQTKQPLDWTSDKYTKYSRTATCSTICMFNIYDQLRHHLKQIGGNDTILIVYAQRKIILSIDDGNPAPDIDLIVVLDDALSFFQVVKLSDYPTKLHSFLPDDANVQRARILLRHKSDPSDCIYNNVVWARVGANGDVGILPQAVIVRNKKFQNLSLLINPFQKRKEIASPIGPIGTGPSSTIYHYKSGKSKGLYLVLGKHSELVPITEKQAKESNIAVKDYPAYNASASSNEAFIRFICLHANENVSLSDYKTWLLAHFKFLFTVKRGIRFSTTHEVDDVTSIENECFLSPLDPSHRHPTRCAVI